MSKRKAIRQKKAIARRHRRKRTVMVCCVICLLLGGGILARWRSLAGGSRPVVLASAPQPAALATPTPTNLIAKDYIYAGGRLVATESVGSNSAQQNGVVTEPDAPSSQPPPPIVATNIAVWRPSNGTWYILNTDNTLTEQAWGVAGDKPVQGDYDGDAKVDFAVFRPSNTIWYIMRSRFLGVTSFQWGLSTDEPLPADYDGDGKTDAALRRGSTWYIRQSSDPTGNTIITQQWGADTDLAVPGDYDGDGRTDIATFRPADATWAILKSSSPADAPETITQQWGESGDLPQVGDFDGDNITDFATFRPGTGIWSILSSFDGTTIEQQWGAQPGDKPAPGDYDGDGRTDICVVRPRISATDNRSTWYIIRSSDGNSIGSQFGLDGDLAVPGRYNRIQSGCLGCP